MSIRPIEFRQALSRFASGVTVISTCDPDAMPIGVTVSAFTSLSLDPPLILICLDNATTRLSAYTEAKSIGINILASDQAPVSNAFAFPGPVPPFEQFPYQKGLLGLPMLNNTLASIECHREAVYPGGDHIIIVGAVAHVSWRENLEPLIYATGQYRTLAPKDIVL